MTPDAAAGTTFIRPNATDGLWEEVWSELCTSLSRQSRCADHPEYPCVRTLGRNAVNDVLSVEEDRVWVRSHQTGNDDVIPASAFRAWWVHLQRRGTAALDPHHPNCPRSDRAVLVGAILARCLPHRIGWEAREIRLLPSTSSSDYRLPEEVPADTPLIEGTCRTVQINAYERDPEARRRCIAAHGTRCCVCGFSFGAVYGPVVDGLIHVHHLRPLSEVGEAHIVDPVVDLRPVCPNCHAVLHHRGPPFSIEEVRTFLQQQQT